MDNETEKIIEEQMKVLPEDVKQAIISVDYKTKLQDITKRQRLLIDQAGKLEMETTLVMIGLEPLADYMDNLQREMDLPPVRAKEIAMDVNENIFKPIRVSLQKMNGVTNQDSEVKSNEEENLDRDQVLKEIENPSLINKGGQSMNFSAPISQAKDLVQTTAMEVRPTQDIEIIPGQRVKDVAKDVNTDIVTAKMTDTTTVSQQIVENKPETKLPEIKNRPSGGIDPYREEIS